MGALKGAITQLGSNTQCPRRSIIRCQACQIILPSLRCWRSAKIHLLRPIRAKNPDDIEPIPAATLPLLNSMDEIYEESRWISGMIREWLDEEWTPLDIHNDLGEAAAKIYVDLRQEGVENEVGDIILGLGSGLMSFNFREAFVGPFDVANKVAELLMLKKSGCDVCCVSDKDKEAIERWDAAVRSKNGSIDSS